jgi:general secretion pathway protein A
MGQAGGRSGLFEAPAVEMIHRISGGIPRAINLVCQAALVYGYADGASVIGADIVRQVHADQAGQVAVRARSEPTAAAGQGSPDTNGDGLKQGIEVIGAELRELKRMMTRQFEALQVKRLGSIESAVARLQGLLQEERRRNAELNKQNQELKVLGLRLRDELKRRDAH